jgi:hypothetical protein
MKIKIILAAVAIIFSVNATMANQSESSLVFWSATGEKLVQPIMAEEATETIPANLKCEFKSFRNSDIFRIFDLGELTKQEEEEEIPSFIFNNYHSVI